MGMNEYEKALSVLRAAVEQSPRDWIARNLLARACIALQRSQEARIQYEAVLQGDPGNEEAAKGMKSLMP